MILFPRYLTRYEKGIDCSSPEQSVIRPMGHIFGITLWAPHLGLFAPPLHCHHLKGILYRLKGKLWAGLVRKQLETHVRG